MIIVIRSTKGHLVITFCMCGLQCHICYRSLLLSLQPQLYWSDLGFSSWLQSGWSQSVVWVPLDTAEVFLCSCQYTPTLAICRWAFSPLIPCIFLPSPQLGCCSVCQRCQSKDGVREISELTAFCISSYNPCTTNIAEWGRGYWRLN